MSTLASIKIVENHKVSRYGYVMNLRTLDAKKHALDRLRPLPPGVVRNLDGWFRVELTYTSNALEGNTLSRRETAVVLEKGSQHYRPIDWADAMERIARKLRATRPEETFFYFSGRSSNEAGFLLQLLTWLVP